MMEQIPADVEDDLLTDVGHHPGPDDGKNDADDDQPAVDQRPAHQPLHVPGGNHLIQHPGHDLGRIQGADGGQHAQRQRAYHLEAVAANVLKGPFQVFPLKGRLQRLVHVKFVARHYEAAPSIGRSFCKA